MNKLRGQFLSLTLFFLLFFGIIGLYFYVEVINEGSFFVSLSDSPSEKNKNLVTQKILASDPSIGSANAQVTIVEYGDFECESCRTAHISIKEVLRQLPNDVRWVWKDVVNRDHVFSESAAIAARCAHQQGKFWEFADLLFANQSRLSPTLYTQIAENLKIDKESFVTCSTSDQALVVVHEGDTQVKDLEITSTPTIYINDTLYKDTIDAFAIINTVKGFLKKK